MINVVTLGSLTDLTAGSIAYANEVVRKESEARVPYRTGNNDEEQNDQDIIKEQMLEIKNILKKAKIDFRDFPFKPQRDSDGEVNGFIPKGKNKLEIKRNIEEYSQQIVEAFQQGKITDEEYALLNDNLESMMEINGIELDEELDLNITDDKIEENIKGFIAHNFGSEENFEKLCESYDNFSFDERKACLQKFNSNINSQLGIAGDLKFSSNPNMKFGNSFYDKGYYITEKQIETQSLDLMLRSMMEKSMIREIEIKRGERIIAQQKQQLHMKIERERQQRNEKYAKEQARKNASNIKKRVYSMYGNN